MYDLFFFKPLIKWRLDFYNNYKNYPRCLEIYILYVKSDKKRHSEFCKFSDKTKNNFLTQFIVDF